VAELFTSFFVSNLDALSHLSINLLHFLLEVFIFHLKLEVIPLIPHDHLLLDEFGNELLVVLVDFILEKSAKHLLEVVLVLVGTLQLGQVVENVFALLRSDLLLRLQSRLHLI
jgi:hypothetical protein